MSAGRIARLVIGIILVLIAAGMIVAGTGIIVVERTVKNENGFITSRTEELRTDSFAIISDTLEIDTGDHGWWNSDDLFTLSLEASSLNDKAVFIGIGPESSVAAYLDNVSHEVVQRWVGRGHGSSDIDYEHHAGSLAPAPPGAQPFWAASASGAGRQSLEWSAESGDWTFVLMNSDGSPGIQADAAVGARVPWLFWVGLAILIVGLILLTVGVLLIVSAARRYGAVHR